MSQQNEIRKKSRFKIKYGKKKSLPQVPLVIVEQCDRDLNNNNNNSKFLSTKATTDLHFTCLNESLKPFELCRFQKHSLSCLHHGTSKTFPSTLYKWKSCIQIKAEISSDKLTTNLQDTSDEICNCHNIIPECNPIQEHLIISKIPSTDIGLCTLSSPNDPSVNFCFNKTIFQNICDVSPASIQRAKRMELVKLTNSQANRSNNSLLNSDRQTTSSFEDNVDKLKSTCSLPEENITHCEQMLYTKPILSPYSPFTDTELNKIPSACHFFPDSKGNPYILFPTQMNNVLPNSSSCSSFNSLGTISSPPSTNASDSNLHYTNNKIYQTSETELCNRDLNGIEHQVTTSSQSLNLLSPITTYASNNNNTSNNNIRKPNSLLTNNYDVLLRCSMNLKKSTTNKSRIKSLGDIFKIPRLSFSSESYPKKSCTYQNINKIDTDIVKSDISNNSPQSSIELCSLTDNAINSKADANFLTVPCETTLLRKKLQIRNKYVRYSTEYVNTTEVVEQEEEHHRTQRAVSVDMSQTFQHRKKMLLQSNDNKATSNMKLWNCMQSSCYYVQPNKSRQVIMN
ncbi:hypothetical protein KSF78_0007974 [Schistosoma japonicum]|nr:hypothetical protein KSF78_0007974 [Schistosoma japonicum]